MLPNLPFVFRATTDHDVKRPRTASEVLMLEIVDIAQRRNWLEYARRLVAHRSSSHILILTRWSDSSVAGAMPAPNLDDPQERKLVGKQSTAERLRMAVEWANDADTQLRGPLQGAKSMEHLQSLARQLLHQHARCLAWLPDTVREAIDRDLCDMHRRFVVRGSAAEDADTPVQSPDDLPEFGISALALSGGGVRSASFSLGAIQMLARVDLLRTFDFVSAVSGGSWAAGWIGAWAYRHRNGINGVSAELGQDVHRDSAPMRWVRRHISYLAPRPGMASGDTWALLVGYVSNWVPIVTLAFLSLLSMTLLVHGLAASARLVEQDESFDAAAIGIALAAAILMGVLRRLTVCYREPARPKQSPRLKRFVIGLTLATSVAMSAFSPIVERGIRAAGFEQGPLTIWHLQVPGAFGVFLLILFGLYVTSTAIAALLASPVGELMAYVFANFGRKHKTSRQGLGRLRLAGKSLRREAYSLLLSTFVAAVLASAVIPPLGQLSEAASLRVAYGPLIALTVFAVAELFGAIATHRRDVDRAWAARLGGFMLAPLLGWAAFCTITLGSTALLRELSFLAPPLKVALFLPFAIIGLLLLAFKRSRDLAQFAGVAVLALALPVVLVVSATYLTRLPGGEMKPAADIWMSCVLATLALGLTAAMCNANRFSLHTIYKQGIVRTFLGASRLSMRNDNVDKPAHLEDGEAPQFEVRRADDPTNIDDNDNPALAWMVSRQGREVPTLLINAAVNGICPTDVEGRAPRQWPFTFSQSFCGSPVPGVGYAATTDFYALGGGNGISLGGAMAVSSAAVSPTSGQWTKPLLAFLLGILNARLGMWIGNPKHPESVRETNPQRAGFTILKEMLGLRSEFGNWIHLSDGGHFENLGLYELVRRGCVRIVVVDASCDVKRIFDDLGACIRQVELDLGVKIHPLAGWDEEHANLAASPPARFPKGCIMFDVVYGEGLPVGKLLYVKPTTSDLANLRADVFNYAKTSVSFPHESTLNQFFTEQQMEAYRSLGESIVESAFAEKISDAPRSPLCDAVSEAFEPLMSRSWAVAAGSTQTTIAGAI